jgi:hypothetical protein
VKISLIWESEKVERFIEVANVDEVKRGRGKIVFVEGLSIAVLNSDGAFYTIEDSCPFDGGSLSDGFLNGNVIECLGDKARFFSPPASVSRSRKGSILGATEYESTRETFMLTWDKGWRRKKAKKRSERVFQPGAVMGLAVL